ncbi:MAG: F0F1 ATP synthase subunit epsilon [Pseudomonadales bacterium]|jgi:F-type H+-transporting ATPase subunit epsilon|nr:F0F1 ATP synthase subunit epsilon [Pseudomonadales bacterium]MDP7144377.1 F0F1 ATP synthase subunit epsilon [Pseudomonadales bacterium]MDP7360893.1 F0F1 ATP synthase subunit epsilon [Pseudomonadales bacterium]HJN52098.1 F0F1 ATP synthase subunit epsilon [Pseudomonadales bacterium]|tara:strand:+ start:2493 stop:2921 length:429 start_codon:yes stop_codon:yes gene_type:complete
MAATVQCDIVSAEKEIFSGRVEMVVATGIRGELGILPGHSALLTAIEPGPVRLIMEGGEEETFFASGGFLEVQPNAVTILADTAIRADDLDEAAVLLSQEKAAKELSDSADRIDFAKAQAELMESAAMIRTIQKTRERSGRS